MNNPLQATDDPLVTLLQGQKTSADDAQFIAQFYSREKLAAALKEAGVTAETMLQTVTKMLKSKQSADVKWAYKQIRDIINASVMMGNLVVRPNGPISGSESPLGLPDPGAVDSVTMTQTTKSVRMTMASNAKEISNGRANPPASEAIHDQDPENNGPSGDGGTVRAGTEQPPDYTLPDPDRGRAPGGPAGEAEGDDEWFRDDREDCANIFRPPSRSIF